jgi:hypothetical protein
MPDCSPKQVDGQCGMATAYADVFALLAAIAFGILTAIIGAIYIRRGKA